ncbi:MAG: MotA/TolQ/ExbB proton channel family protein [Gammaproteobacteria bacterium]|nr:MotA/TolQ/ExbB proton channel family protein [Gammaproteobacteria bacterium]
MINDAHASALSNLGHADPLVAGVLWLLLLVSAATWFLIIYKAVELARIQRAGAAYVQAFWNSADAVIFLRDTPKDHPHNPMAHLARGGVTALEHHLSHFPNAEAAAAHVSDILTRALRQTIQNQTTHLETGLGVLATVGNTAPFVGLFGTVVGIMAALHGIADAGTADLSTVSGPIGEALIATAAGIGCAIPAVVGYNSFIRRLKVFGNALDSFAYDVLSHLATDKALRTLAATAKG